MDLVFDKKDIGIKFFSNKDLDINLHKKLIIYPIIRYKIYAPVIDDLGLNVFQKYVLSILNKGNFSLETISNWLCLDLILVKTVAAELENKRLIDLNTMNITSKGKKLIEGTFSWFENLDILQKDFRYVFQDIFTQELYPIILPFERLQDNIRIEKDKLIYGTKGSKDKFDYTLITPEKSDLDSIAPPEREQILNALNVQAKKYLPNSKSDLKEVPNAVNFVDEVPELCYCAMWITSEKENKIIENIDVLDPFGNSDDAYWLKEIIIRAQKQNDVLKGVLASLVCPMKQEERMSISESMKAINLEIYKSLDLIFDSTKKNSSLYLAIEGFLYEIELYNFDKKVGHIQTAFVKGQIVLETLFQTISRKFKDDNQRIIDQQTYQGGPLRVSRQEIELKIRKINSQSELPDWTYDEFKDVYKALKNPDKASLRSLFIAAVLTSASNPKNPFFEVLKGKNNTATCIEHIAKRRNEFAHKQVSISANEVSSYLDEIQNIKRDIQEIIQLFLKNQ